MRRREFLGALGGAAVAWPLAAHAQQQAMPAVGFIHVGSPAGFDHLVTAFRSGLAESNFVEGRNVAVEYRWAEGQLDRVPALVADLIRLKVSVLAGTQQGALAAKRAGSTIPFVFSSAADPIQLGLVRSLSRPGSNMTGFYLWTSGLEAKRLGLLRDVIPNATTMAVLVDPNYTTTDAQVRDVQEAAARLGLQLVIVRANSDRDIEAAFATFVQRRAAALLVGASPFFNNKRDKLVALSTRYKLPAAYEWREFATAGGLVSYGNSIVEAYRQLGSYTGRILRGTNPTDLPVIQPSKFELVINLKTARSLGVSISADLLTLADEVIE